MEIQHECVISDIVKLREILGNLISNAIEFTMEADRVVLIVEEKSLSSKKVRVTLCMFLHISFYSEDNQQRNY